MPLKVVERKNRGGALTIVGTIRFPTGERFRLSRRAQSNDRRLAEEEAAVLEAHLLRTGWHGEREGARSIGAAFLAYFEAEPRSTATKARYTRVLRALGDRPLSSIKPETVAEVARKVIGPHASVANVNREVLNPLRAVMRLAADRGWVRMIRFKPGREPRGRTKYLLPSEVERLIVASAEHLRPILIFLVCTGARVSEALELEWQDVDLVGARAILWRTKNGKRRNVALVPRAVESLRVIQKRVGVKRVFSRDDGKPYVDYESRGGGRLKTAFKGALKRAGVDPEFRPHDLRHTWASWTYALEKDPVKLMRLGDWSALSLVMRYTHLLPVGHEDEIRTFFGLNVVWSSDHFDDRQLKLLI